MIFKIYPLDSRYKYLNYENISSNITYFIFFIKIILHPKYDLIEK